MEQSVRGLPRFAWVVIALAGVGLVAAAAVLLQRGETAAGEAPAPAVAVLVQPVERTERAVAFDVSGEVEARRTVNVGFKVAGVVGTVHVEEGESVRSGDVLAQLDDEDYRLNMELAETQVELARDAHARASQIYDENGLPEADFVKAEVALRQATLQHELARRQYEDARLLAPTGGVVARRGINNGEQAGPGNPVFTIVAIDPAQVRVGVPEAEIASVRVGQPASVRFPALPGTVLEGRVEMVGVVADPVSRTYPVKIGIPNPAGRLRPGMIAEASIREGGSFEVTSIPGEAVVPDAAGTPIVFVYDAQEERVHSRRIRVGTVYGQEVEVLSGLEGGEMVVVGGQHRVRDGARVVATTASGATAAATRTP